MIAAWMAYCLADCLLLALAARALESGFRLRGLPLRWVWVGALSGSLLLCALPWIQQSPTPAEELSKGQSQLPRGARSSRVPGFRAITSPPTRALDRLASPTLARLDRPLSFLLVFLSGAGLLVLGSAARILRRKRRMWRRTRIDGVSALLSRDTGPAVVGFLDPAIVLPEWVFALDESQRRLVTAHEEEHLLAGDPRLLTLALAALALMPWNAPLWWLMRRLRHAVELDCDARVLARGLSPVTYGALLVEIGQRAPGFTFPITAFIGSSSLLERRIRAMFSQKPQSWSALAGASSVLAGLLVLLACTVPLPTMAAPSAPATDAAGADATMQAADTLLYYMTDGVMKLRVRTLDEKDAALRPSTICSDPKGDSATVEVIWPGCGGYQLYGDQSVRLPKVHPVIGDMAVGGPQWNAGLRTGDVILSVDGHDTQTMLYPFRGNRAPAPGADAPYRVRVQRGGEVLELKIPA